MAGMNSGMMGSLIDTGVQGAQNTSKQEYNQRQALYQNLVQATDDSAWLNAHFPNLFGWTPSGSGGGGYQAASSAPQAYAGNPIKSDFAGAMGADADRKQKQPVMDSEAAYKNFLSGGGQQGGGQSSYSSLWS